MSDDRKDYEFDHAFAVSSRDVWHDVRIDRARQTRDYLTDLVESSHTIGMIGQFTVSEIIEYLDRHL